MYDSQQYVAGPAAKEQVKASVLLILGCQDDQLSFDGDVNGVFTGALKHVWEGGKYMRSYKNFHSDVESLMPSTQRPNYYLVGARNTAFEAQSPFTL
jgi:metacaspase-1